MSKPTELKLKKKDQKSILKHFKTTKNARKISESLNLPNRQVMFFLENEGLRRYSETSYS